VLRATASAQHPGRRRCWRRPLLGYGQCRLKGGNCALPLALRARGTSTRNAGLRLPVESSSPRGLGELHGGVRPRRREGQIGGLESPAHTFTHCPLRQQGLEPRARHRLTAVVERRCDDGFETDALLAQTAAALQQALAVAVQGNVKSSVSGG
jgi:hypothetical protein